MRNIGLAPAKVPETRESKNCVKTPGVQGELMACGFAVALGCAQWLWLQRVSLNVRIVRFLQIEWPASATQNQGKQGVAQSSHDG